MKQIGILSLYLGIAVGLHAHPQERTWTDSLNRTTEATLVKIEDGNAFLKLASGTVVPFPIEKLSEADQEYLANPEVLVPAVKEPGEGAGTTDRNFDAPWPDRISFREDPEVAIVTEDAEEKNFVYESANFRYICNVRLARSVVRGFAMMFEATHQYCRELPLALNGGKQTDGRYPIHLFETEAQYHQAGGPPGSAGVFIGGKNVILVPLTSLGVRPVGSGYMLDRDKSSKTLPHEIVHQLTPNNYFAPGPRGWFTEGIAEYVAVTPYRSGSYNVRLNQRPILEYVTAYGKKNMGGRALGETIQMSSLRAFMLQEYSSFTGSNAQLNYGMGLLITNYFLHMDRDGDRSRISKFLAALLDGKIGPEALDVLLDGQTFEELEADIAKAFSRKGVEIIFAGGTAAKN